jgi:hypothetical protein
MEVGTAEFNHSPNAIILLKPSVFGDLYSPISRSDKIDISRSWGIAGT